MRRDWNFLRSHLEPELSRERSMVRQIRPRATRHPQRSMPEVADIYTVESQHGQPRRKSPGRPATRARVNFRERAIAHQPPMRPASPVVEIAGNDERSVGRDLICHQCKQALDLLKPVRLPQCEMHADRVQRLPGVRDVEHAMQHAARFGSSYRHVDVPPGGDRVFRQDRIAVMAAGRDRIAAVGVLRPDLVGEEFVLRSGRFGSAGDAHFLKEDQVRSGSTESFPDPREGPVSPLCAESLVGVQRQYANGGFR